MSAPLSTLTPASTRMATPDVHARFGPRLTTALPGPRARKIIDRDESLMSPSYTRSYPLAVKRGYGCRIEDVDGNEFLDFTAGIAVNSTGHCHPEVVKAIQDQAAQLIHMSGTDFYYDLMPKLAERLSAVAPMPGPHRLYFSKLRRRGGGVRPEAGALPYGTPAGHQLPGQLPRAHHGRALAHRLQGAAEAALRPVRARGYACALSLRLSRLQRRAAGARKPSAWRVRASLKRSYSRRRVAPEEVAAIFVEPIQGESGYVVPPNIFLEEIRRICDRQRHPDGRR